MTTLTVTNTKANAKPSYLNAEYYMNNNNGKVQDQFVESDISSESDEFSDHSSIHSSADSSIKY